jgi:hypothetical protein
MGGGTEELLVWLVTVWLVAVVAGVDTSPPIAAEEDAVPVDVEDEVCTNPPRAPEEGVVPVDVEDQVCTSPP